MSIASANDGLDSWAQLLASALIIGCIMYSVLDYRERSDRRSASVEERSR